MAPHCFQCALRVIIHPPFSLVLYICWRKEIKEKQKESYWQRNTSLLQKVWKYGAKKFILMQKFLKFMQIRGLKKFMKICFMLKKPYTWISTCFCTKNELFVIAFFHMGFEIPSYKMGKGYLHIFLFLSYLELFRLNLLLFSFIILLLLPWLQW